MPDHRLNPIATAPSSGVFASRVRKAQSARCLAINAALDALDGYDQRTALRRATFCGDVVESAISHGETPASYFQQQHRADRDIAAALDAVESYVQRAPSSWDVALGQGRN